MWPATRRGGGGNLAAVTERASWEFEEAAPIAPGRTVLKSLGGGTRYEVYLVWDEVMFAICVAKVLRPDHTQDERALRDLRREAEILERLAHPVIVRGFDAVVEGPHPHVLIEHLEGPSLRRLIRRGGPLPLEQLLPLALHVAGALEYMRHMDVVHLDVKPDNIIMGVPPRLIDLSIARTRERAARISSPVGTDAYMAPEQCDPNGRHEIGSASDVWGLGATLHHAVAGSVPFPRPKDARDSEDPELRFPQLIDEPEPLPEHAPADLRKLIASMLKPAPIDRPTAGDVAAGLEPLVARLPSKMVFSRRGAVFR
jgi:eukaryotic-like serine/threonine-protein kinase